eukprot:GHRR01000265.1.p1 GENE.GHRR01000265.1~~GHRR01000265.1.p1  ORF type:complete len:262 (+),score=39.38 GHRR01000265.1:189-974(+)
MPFPHTERILSPAHASTTQPARLALPSQRRMQSNQIVCGGLKKETKRLAKTLKAHRKRLESILVVEPASPVLAYTDTQMQAVLSEIDQLRSALRSIQNLQANLEKAASSSSESSDSEDEAPCNNRVARRAATSSSSRPTIGSRSSMVIAASKLCLEVPQIATAQQHQVDITQQPPQHHTAAGCILVCQGKACMRKGGLQVLQAASHAASKSPALEVLPCKCLGKCKQGPAMRMRTDQEPGCPIVTDVDASVVPDLVAQCFA